jgi:hypothetical protein
MLVSQEILTKKSAVSQETLTKKRLAGQETFTKTLLSQKQPSKMWDKHEKKCCSAACSRLPNRVMPNGG